MTQDAQDQIYGKMLRELKDASAKIIALQKEAEDISRLFYDLGNAFETNPDPQRPITDRHLKLFASREEVMGLLDDIKKTEESIARLKRSLEPFGIS
jgi:hypothetical protein